MQRFFAPVVSWMVSLACVLSLPAFAQAGAMRPYVQPDSSTVPKPPPIKRVELVPLGNRVPAELDGIVTVLAERFPGLDIRLKGIQPLPDGTYSKRREQVIWDELLPKLPTAQGTLYVINEDLGANGANFMYAIYDLPTARAVASVSRMRSLEGLSMPPDTRLEGEALELARFRLQNQLTSSIAKLMGMSFPCHAPVCVLRAPVRIQHIDLKSTHFCAKHKAEFAKLAKERKLRR
ncbi:hypothetical protein [Myxococcus sp. NMCA1]|uniref:hypothetical protein n=1 Tax=Myxococcus sp. NMCA1 TaxID=2996785 RepID=UPI0022864DA0|nr:hypothetical protein [Myxococcus sp. NMCA1]WAM28292.1 hypothetical protein OZ403_09295 [Myxococcus sp. NMCA1]